MSEDLINFLTLIVGFVFGVIYLNVIKMSEEKANPVKKCEVCGKPIKLTKEKLRLVTVSETGGLEILAQGCKISVYETFLCDHCGCENVIKKMVGGVDFATREDNCNIVEGGD